VEELDIELTGIQATMLLNFVLAEIAPSAYNAGVAAAEAFFQGSVGGHGGDLL
jgi:uncharacterized protein (DUF2164 family)